MLNHRKRRLYFLLLIIVSSGIAVGLALIALQKNLNLYQTPQQVAKLNNQEHQIFRLGGMVVKGSVHQSADLHVNFSLTDYHANIQVEYQGILPSLFHEGQGIVAQGHLNNRGIFIADQVLAKHDANYKPPSIGPAA